MKSDIVQFLRLLWIPTGWARDAAFEVAVITTPVAERANSPQWKAQARFWDLPEIPGSEMLIITELDEPQPLPADAEFIIMMTFTGDGTRNGAEQFVEWQTLSFEKAREKCAEVWGGDLATMAQAARQLIRLPVGASLH